ncbi:DUF2577 domain-containing protein [Paenibacillus filicis]|uniref:DUF2577 domain-containing protein n=1 Tax=Paenibacillus filicis TaxID=669464 RepID=A0ABU9DQW1_9BACL
MSVSRMLDVIKKASLGAVDAGQPLAVLFGTVVSVRPLEVSVDERFLLPEELLLVPESMRRQELTLSGQKVVIRDGLYAGDRLLLLRIQGGGQFIVLDRVVSP